MMMSLASETPQLHSGEHRLQERAALARERARVSRQMMVCCRFCAHRCGVNRLAGELGPCRAGLATKVFSIQSEVSDELELVPTFAIAFSGCDLRCPFCITALSSWNASAGHQLPVKHIAGQAVQAVKSGARTVMFLGGEPTIHLPTVLEIVSLLPDSIRLVFKTNGRCSAEARDLLDGLLNVWVVDYKFGNPTCASRLVGVEDYAVAVQENLLWAARHSELITRHLIIPGHVRCCWQPIAAWLAEYLPGHKVNLRTGFWPTRLNHQHQELLRLVSDGEAQQARRIAEKFHLQLIS